MGLAKTNAKKIILSVPATSANVGPGYDIFALALDQPRDIFEISINDIGEINISVDKDEYDIPTKVEDNTAGLAAKQLLKAKNINQGIDIHIRKTIPHGGGLGTTGASAAAAVYGINQLFQLNLSLNEMVDFARKGEVASGGSPHADNVAAALLGGFVLIKSYDPIDVLRLKAPEFHLVLAAITKSQRTTRGFITYSIGQEKLKQQMANCARIIHAIHTKDAEEFGKAMSTDYIHEPVRGGAIENYFSIKNKILQAGAFGCTISGGGSSVIAVCPQNKQDEITNLMEKEFSDNPYFVKVFQSKISNEGVKIL